MSRTIEIVVAKDGSTRITPMGFAGEECRAATRPYERALGRVESDAPLPELYEEVHNEASEQQKVDRNG